ncbi:hypothetical protein GUITHDRAFT_112573 [Guillardia theta CCMP2712]|uniref:GAF domain-containing protein n=1 Tax=Guillardia theta (strain CCMP2712) TaxID=905079 RepID=L1IZ66_GUITC|nr:hypothetical protein GUITHDRAFT_112573 [Guillardia theta CCMP2712]EKX41362.1 hypothetical protein GUITHDRAFT_112573 [Guillardia theta CCMP2712]|eukprot:XP_005828342.1 hypothetical protein GUITHDRAFT_112573 [Guillardia theta CCMP2712]
MRRRPASAVERRMDVEGHARQSEGARRRPASAVPAAKSEAPPPRGSARQRATRPASATFSTRTPDFMDPPSSLPLRPASAFRFSSREEARGGRRRPSSSLTSYRKDPAWEAMEAKEGGQSFAYTPFFDTVDAEVKSKIADGSNALRLKIQSAMANLYMSRDEPEASTDDLVYQDLTKEMTRDLLIAQLEDEIRYLQLVQTDLERERVESLQELRAHKWRLSHKLSKVEKLNVFLRETMITGTFEPTKMDEIDQHAVTSSHDGPIPRTLLLHDAINKNNPNKQTFHRIINPTPLPLSLSSHTPLLNLWIAYVPDASCLTRETSLRAQLVKLQGSELDTIQHWRDLKRILSSGDHRRRLKAMGCSGVMELMTKKGKQHKMHASLSMEMLKKHADKSNPLVISDKASQLSDEQTEEKIHNMTILTAKLTEKNGEGKLPADEEDDPTTFDAVLMELNNQSSRNAEAAAEHAAEDVAEGENREGQNAGVEGQGSIDLSLFKEILQSKEGEKGGAVVVQKHKDTRRRQTVQQQVQRLLRGQEALSKFQEVVASLDLQTRLDMIEEVASNLVGVGMVIRLMDAMRRIVHDSGVDETLVLLNLQQAIMQLVHAGHVRMWLTDERNSKIWEWTASNPEGQQQRSFTNAEVASGEESVHVRKRQVKPGIAADVARTGMGINIPFPAVQSKSFSIEVDRLQGENARTIMCEPIRHGGQVVAVIQCYNKVSPSGEEPFTRVDELLVRSIGELAGGLIHKCSQLKTLLEASRKALHVSSLTRHYPFNYQDLFLLAHAYTRDMMERVEATHCQLYVSSVLDNNRKFLWSFSPAGLGEPLVIPHGVGVAGWVAEHEEAVRSEDVRADPRFAEEVDFVYLSLKKHKEEGEEGKEETHGLLALPLFNLDGSLLGVCSFIDKKGGGTFTEMDEQVTRVSKRMMEIVVNTSLANHSHFFAQETVFEALFQLKRLTECDRAMLMVSETKRSSRMRKKQLRLAAHSDSFIYERKEQSLSLPIADGLFGYVARTGFDIVIPDAQVDPRFNRLLDRQLDYSTTSLMCIPVPHHDSEESILGVLVLSNKSNARAFTPMDIAAAHVMRRCISYLYSNSIKDKPTG